jgi:hypothetical protein
VADATTCMRRRIFAVLVGGWVSHPAVLCCAMPCHSHGVSVLDRCRTVLRVVRETVRRRVERRESGRLHLPSVSGVDDGASM